MTPTEGLNLEPLWMPFTPNRTFKESPRLLVGAKGVYYTSAEGRQIIDAISGLWCVNAGHCRERIVEAIQRQAATLDYATGFNMHGTGAFELADRLKQLAPAGMGHAFFTNSGSEAVDTALKMALGYNRARGDAGRTVLIGRERGYHGVGFGGMSVGGIQGNREMFTAGLLPNVGHIRHTHLPESNAFSKGQPAVGAELADDLERLVAEHGAGTIAAVIVEPVAGSTGVLVPPLGYLQRLRELCTKHGILLIFDEVITAFGRTGNAFASQTFGVTPDLITTAKGLTNGAVPMGAVIVSETVFDAFMHGPDGAIELPHGYTYSGHALASAAALATLDLYQEESLFERSAELAPYFEAGVHSLRGLPNVIDLRNFGMMAGIELEPRPGAPAKRAFEAFLKAYERGVLIRTTGDTIALSPPLITERHELDRIFGVLTEVLSEVA